MPKGAEPELMDKWKVQDAVEMYGVRNWGKGYFTINKAGHLQVHPTKRTDLFVDLKEAGWTLIVSTQPTQEKYDANDKTKIWGAYGYDPKFDVVRVPMTMMTPAVSIDQFSIGFVDMTDAGGKLAMGWDKTAAVVPFTVAQ